MKERVESYDVLERFKKCRSRSRRHFVTERKAIQDKLLCDFFFVSLFGSDSSSLVKDNSATDLLLLWWWYGWS